MCKEGRKAGRPGRPSSNGCFPLHTGEPELASRRMGSFFRCVVGILKPFVELFVQPDDQLKVPGFVQRNANRVLTFEDLERLDVAFDQELTVFDSERIQVGKNGELVGVTAVFRDKEVILSDGILPMRYIPSCLKSISS